MRARTVIVLTALSLTGCQLAVEFDRSRLSDDVVDAAVIDAGDAGTPVDAAVLDAAVLDAGDAAVPSDDAAMDAATNDGATLDAF